jgi:hypothetical protein
MSATLARAMMETTALKNQSMIDQMQSMQWMGGTQRLAILQCWTTRVFFFQHPKATYPSYFLGGYCTSIRWWCLTWFHIIKMMGACSCGGDSPMAAMRVFFVGFEDHL